VFADTSRDTVEVAIQTVFRDTHKSVLKSWAGENELLYTTRDRRILSRMPENQQHGFVWEKDIRTNVFLLDGNLPYTATHDIPKEQNRFDPTENISIKTTGRTTIDLGDALRVFRYTPEDRHTMVVIHYQQQEDRKVLRNLYEVDLNQRDVLWGTVTEEDIQQLNDLIRNVPAGQRTTDTIKAKKKELNAKSGVIQFNPKIDSKTQRRLQCSIPKFQACQSILRTSTTEPILRGIAIAAYVVSGRRVRNHRL
jgi:hypothetical protein